MYILCVYFVCMYWLIVKLYIILFYGLYNVVDILIIKYLKFQVQILNVIEKIYIYYFDECKILI